MLIVVTREALTVKPEEGAVWINLLIDQILPDDILFLMTGSAFHASMLPFQDIARLRVIEMVLCILPVDEIIIPSLMLDMADTAILMLLVGMQPFFRPNFALECFMAGQAFFGSELLFKSVAFVAVTDPLQGFMRFGEISRRKLGESVRYEYDCQQKKDR
jgi:hypothetical protein